MGVPWLWIGGIAASIIVTHQVLKPRLPIYRIRPLLGIPRITWDENELMLGMPVSVSMHNENFMEIDIYSITFDMFYMNEQGKLLHVTDIKDHFQAPSKRSDASKTEKPPVLWQIPRRSNFTIDDMLYMSMDTRLFWNILANSRFYSSLWRGSGSFWLPTTGVALIKATTNDVGPGIPATLSVVCDNLVENLVVQGLSCVLHDVQPGWANLKRAASSVRSHALTKLRANLEGIVLGNRARTSRV